MAQNNKQLTIKAEDKILRGVYANAMRVFHTKEEFVIDFFNLFPPQGTLNARVIMNPGHLKRMLQVLDENVKKYEAQFGKIEAAENINSAIGFAAKEEK